MAEELICVGAIAGAFGVRGDLRIKSFCADPAAIASYAPLLSEDGAREFHLTISRPIKNGLAGRIRGISSKEAADALRGTQLFVPRDRLPQTGEDEYYHSDLIGMEVVDTGGTVLGTVRNVVDHGAGDILEIFAPGRKSTALLPFTRAAVPTVDLASRRIVADPPDGIF